MSDFAQYLPLGQRARRNEHSVTSDWRPLIGETLGLVCDLLGSLSAEEWERPSLRSGWRIRDMAGHLVWRIGSSTSDMVRCGGRAIFRNGMSPPRFIDTESRRAAAADPRELLRQLRGIADARLTLHGRRRITELTEVVVHGYDIAHPLGRSLAFPSVATGAVALSRALTAPTPIKAVIRNRTLSATDDGWSVGHGPELAASAEALVLFLFGRSAVVPSVSEHGTPG